MCKEKYMSKEEAKEELKEIQQLINSAESKGFVIGHKALLRLTSWENKLITYLNNK